MIKSLREILPTQTTYWQVGHGPADTFPLVYDYINKYPMHKFTLYVPTRVRNFINTYATEMMFGCEIMSLKNVTFCQKRDYNDWEMMLEVDKIDWEICFNEHS